MSKFDISKVKVSIKIKGETVAYKDVITGIWRIVRPKKEQKK